MRAFFTDVFVSALVGAAAGIVILALAMALERWS